MRVLVDFYACKNLGDDLFVKVLLERYPNIEFSVLSREKYYTPFENYSNAKLMALPEKSIFRKVINRVFSRLKLFFIKLERTNFMKELKTWERFFDKIAASHDIYLQVGGSIFIEGSDREFKLRLAEIKKNSFRKKPKLILGSNFGPYQTEDFFDFYNDYFQQFDDVCFRDNSSGALFKSNSKVRTESDMVFLLNTELLETTTQKNHIGFSIIDCRKRPDLKKYAEAYEQLLKNLIRDKLENGYTVTLFSFCEAEGDLSYAKHIRSIFTDTIYIVTYKGDMESFLREFICMDEIVATRFHAVILSILFGKKLTPIIYSDKTKNILNDIGGGLNMLDIRQLKSNEKYSLVNQEICQSKIIDLKSKAENQFVVLDAYLG